MSGAKTPHGITWAEEKYATMLACGCNMGEAFVACFPRSAAWKPDAMRSKASMIANKPLVRARVVELMEEGMREHAATVKDVHRQLATLAFGDARDVVQVRRICCRHCWGKDFKEQFTPAEMARRRKAWQALPARKRGKFDEEGGVGYDRRRLPNDDCPECHGEGEVKVWVADSRMLTGRAAPLYAGAEVDGAGKIKVRLRDQDAALDRMARVLGAYKEDNAQLTNPLVEFIRSLSGNVVQPSARQIKDDGDDDTEP